MYDETDSSLTLRTAIDPDRVNTEANGRVKPSKRIAKVHMAAAASMYGLRRPKRDFELSARTPTGTVKYVHEDGVRTNR